MKTVILNADEMATLMQQAAGQGGFQDLLRYLQGKLHQETHRIDLTDEDRGKICRYAFDYGNGGWENRLREIFGHHLGEMR